MTGTLAAKTATVIGITGVSRSGKGWVSKALAQEIRTQFSTQQKSFAIVGQDAHWEKFVTVNVGGKKPIRPSQESPDSTDWPGFTTAIRQAAASHDVVLAEGFQLLHSPQIVAMLDFIFYIELSEAEAKKRRTAPYDKDKNPNPVSEHDFRWLLWPEHLKYVKEKVDPLIAEGRVVKLPSPNSEAERDVLVRKILAAAKEKIAAGGGGSTGGTGGDPTDPPAADREGLGVGIIVLLVLGALVVVGGVVAVVWIAVGRAGTESGSESD